MKQNKNLKFGCAFIGSLLAPPFSVIKSSPSDSKQAFKRSKTAAL